jgi:hypothetical protein
MDQPDGLTLGAAAFVEEEHEGAAAEEWFNQPGQCRICGLTYAPHSPRDRAFHRRRHIISPRPRQPKPDPEFADNRGIAVSVEDLVGKPSSWL